MKTTHLLLTLLALTVAACGPLDEPSACTDDHGEAMPEPEIGEADFELRGGVRYQRCSNDEIDKLHDAYGVLLHTSNQGFGAFHACIDAAPLVESRCRSTDEIADMLHRSNVTRITCTDLGGSNGRAQVGISGSRMRIDHRFIARNDADRIASVMLHELAHNRGFTHRRNDSGSQYYANTVPEQVEACILNGRPNASMGPATRDHRIECGFEPPRSCDRWPALFDHEEWGGRQVTVTRDVRDLRSLRFNNEASSICVPRGWRVTLYENRNFGGRSLTLDGEADEARLRDFARGRGHWKNVAASVRVSRR